MDYDYLHEVTLDIYYYLRDNENLYKTFSCREEFEMQMYDQLWALDEITGNGPDGYASKYECEKMLCHNWDMILASWREFHQFPNLPAGREAIIIDCIIRLYCLPQAITKAAEMLEKENYLVYAGE